ERTVRHPVRPADRWVSVRAQRGNGDDVLMRRLHGRDWRLCGGAPEGTLRRHVATTSSAVAAAALAATGHRRSATVAAGAVATSIGTFAWSRIAPGPRTRDEVGTMLATSVAIPFA